MSATITITKLHTILTQKLGEETAENLTTYIEQKIDEDVKSATTQIATKDFVEKAVEKSKSEMIKWFFGFFVALAIMILGLYRTIIFGLIL